MQSSFKKAQKIDVAFINRYPKEGHFSLESYFASVGKSLQSHSVDLKSYTSPYDSKGLISRLRTIHYARIHQASVTHVTGDIHFAALGLNYHRTVVTVADCGRLHQTKGIKRELLRQVWFQQPLSRVAAVTVISPEVKNDLLTWVPSLNPDRVHVVPVCISPLFNFSAKAFDCKAPRILHVGTTGNKNLVRLIQAMKGLRATLVLIGKLDASLRELIASHNIHCENHVNLNNEQVVNVYKSVDLLSFVSTLEGFGMPILEAQAIGRPVLTSNCSSMPYVSGNGALLVDPFSVESIRAGLIRLIEDSTLRHNLVANGVSNVQRFSADMIAEQYLQIYRSLLFTSS